VNLTINKREKKMRRIYIAEFDCATDYKKNPEQDENNGYFGYNIS
jgi:hypothetical protein